MSGAFLSERRLDTRNAAAASAYQYQYSSIQSNPIFGTKYKYLPYSHGSTIANSTKRGRSVER